MATTDTAHHLTPEQRGRARKAVVATSLGNALEWFDVIVFGFFAVPISQNFFPAQSKEGALGLILVFLTFFVTYLVRPVGALIIGSYGDTHGRKAAMTLTIALMTIGLLVLAAAPPAAVVGPIVAPLVLMVARILQGLSAGGEFGSSTAFLTENAADRKSFYASWQVATQGISMFLAAAFGYTLNTLLPAADLLAWGWRVPFFFGLLIAPVGWYIRQHMDDTPEYQAAENAHETESAPLGETFKHHFPRVLAAVACVGVATISVYFLSYMPSFAMTHLHLPSWSGYLGSFISGVIMFGLSPFVGKLADRVGRIPIMLPAAIVGLLVIYPMFSFLVANPSVPTLTIVQVVVGLVMTAYFAPLPSLMSSFFPVSIRTTGMSLSYNIAVTLFGGLAPLALETLIALTGSNLAPSFWYMIVAVLSIIGLVVARKVYQQD
ncbi:MFS transporter [Nigerium massiliense]|uniref:MFS transporter n=1 Tax=Nigerium massiliense TaxID=1522317 RepID=UPI00058EEB72|nr:MFS transporter [Nigerium massiliense]